MTCCVAKFDLKKKAKKHLSAGLLRHFFHCRKAKGEGFVRSELLRTICPHILHCRLPCTWKVRRHQSHERQEGPEEVGREDDERPSRNPQGPLLHHPRVGDLWKLSAVFCQHSSLFRSCPAKESEPTKEDIKAASDDDNDDEAGADGYDDAGDLGEDRAEDGEDDEEGPVAVEEEEDAAKEADGEEATEGDATIEEAAEGEAIKEGDAEKEAAEGEGAGEATDEKAAGEEAAGLPTKVLLTEEAEAPGHKLPPKSPGEQQKEDPAPVKLPFQSGPQGLVKPAAPVFHRFRLPPLTFKLAHV